LQIAASRSGSFTSSPGPGARSGPVVEDDLTKGEPGPAIRGTGRSGGAGSRP
jgi:hypothetical protein